jgi:hypothetical protein
MISVTSLKAFVTEIQSRIAAINFSEVVVDDSQLTNFLKDLERSQNQMLFGIIPEYPIQGDQDRLKWNNQLMFMVLEKTNSRNQKHSDFLQMMENTLQSAKAFTEILLSEKAGDNGDFCGIANQLIENSIRIYPIWNKAECNGWGIDIDLLSDI